MTVESLQTVTDFSTNPKEFVDFFEPLKDCAVLNEIKEIIAKANAILDVVDVPNKMENKASSLEFRPDTKSMKLQKILADVQTHLEEMGLYGGSKSVLLHMIQLEYIKKYSDEPVSQICNTNNTVFQSPEFCYVSYFRKSLQS